MDAILRSLDTYTLLTLGIGIGMIIYGPLWALIDTLTKYILSKKKKK